MVVKAQPLNLDYRCPRHCMSINSQTPRNEIDRIIAAEFGVNASYVADLFQQFEKNPQSVDEEWREFFDEMLGGTDGASTPSGMAVQAVAQARSEQAPIQPAGAQTSLSEPPHDGMQPGVAETSKLQLKGPALRIAQNMEASLAVPTATSTRQVPVKLLEENRLLINKHFASSGRRVSYTHLVARAIVKALEDFPQLNDSYQGEAGALYRVHHQRVNLGIAVDVTKKDGSRSLLVPNLKGAGSMRFPDLVAAYDDTVARARDGKLQIADFQDTTISLTNPGTIGTSSSNPRLMSGQGVIIATGAIQYPPEYQAMAPEALSRLGISKVMAISSTYDHRIIQGAESGSFLALIDELLHGSRGFYDWIFAELGIPFRPYKWAVDRNPAILGEERHADEVGKQARVLELINAYRVRGHLIADINPLGAKGIQYHPELDIDTYGLTIWDLDREFITGGLGGAGRAPLRQIVEWLRRFYCGRFGIEYRNIQSPSEKEWLRARIEREQPAPSPKVKKQILWKLISAEQFEKFLGTKYLGQKRFSIEGAEAVVALLDQLIEQSAATGIRDITIGMSHRGRLNVIANVIGRFCERIFTSFEGSIHPKFPHDQGDVKYHQGATGIRETDAGSVSLTVPPNPSHLEFVDPVVEGMVRAKQDMADAEAGDSELSGSRGRILAVLVHGDAAFAGEGIVAETLNLSGLEGYSTDGTIHFIVNNQLGFTTPPEAGRTSVYSTDVAKMIQIPIFHVNGDDLDAAFEVLLMALDYRREFKKDVVIDVMGFRRHGHNEGDEPTYTQPVMYRRVRSHPGVMELYSRRLVREGVISEQEVASLIEERKRRYENALLGAKEIVAKTGQHPEAPLARSDPEPPEQVDTAVDRRTLIKIARAITTVPKDFNLNPKVTSLLSRRAKMADGQLPVDFGMAEQLAFGSILLDGISVRLAGQDSIRGTFSHRHAAFYDTQTDEIWVPLEHLAPHRVRFRVYDSPLSEAGALGFEYGYSVAVRDELVLWEAQFGDFINAAQVIVDQFIASGEEKWDQKSRLVLLLPHGDEGQGPEHSSARIERFLQLCASYNMQIVNCSTAAQYFHVLRRQVMQATPKPLIVMTPKSLLRQSEASSHIDEFAQGRFLHAISDDSVEDPSAIRTVLACSGKVYFELVQERTRIGDAGAAIIRLEQYYPFPGSLLDEHLKVFENAQDVRWVQEEPANMGAWSFVEPRLRAILRAGQTLRYAGRPESPSPATGSHTVYEIEKDLLLRRAFSNE
jgi:2-oxoglutarate decarboxylase